jgi:uncharacterized delta-60 repeat protein
MKCYLLIFALISYSFYSNASGPSSLDTSFNGTGLVSLLIGSSSSSQGENAYGVAVQNDGKVVVTGTIYTTAYFGFVARFNVNGSLDTTFGSGLGYVLINFASATQSQAYSLVVQLDGNIVVAGSINNTQAFVARYTPNGTLDTTTFGAGLGYALLPTLSSSSAKGVQLQTDSKIVIAGTYNSSTRIFVARYTSNGILDTTTFGSGLGYVTTLIGTTCQAQGLAIQRDGKIVIGGSAAISGISQIIAARYTTSGLLDTTTFGSGLGYVATAGTTNASGFGIAIQADQKTVVVGTTVNPTNPDFSAQLYTIVRFTSNGTLDSSFNNIGSIQSSIGTYANAVAIQLDQKIVTSGFIRGSSAYNVVATRYNTDGSTDSSFEVVGNQTLLNLIARALAIALDGKIIIGGGAQSDTMYEFAVARFLGGATPQLGTTTAINSYGYNATWLSEFLYINFYAQIITDTTARNATIALTNSIIASYISAYSEQTGFNYIAYAYLMNEDLLAAQATLGAAYASSYTQIIQFFTSIITRQAQLLI